MENEPKPFSDGDVVVRARSSRSKRAILIGVVLGLLVFVFYAGYQKGRYGALMTENRVAPAEALFLNTSEQRDQAIDFSLFWRVWDLLKEKYLGRNDLDAKELFYGAIDGMLAATGDPYTTFFSPKENREFKEDLAGSFEGIGAEMGIQNDILTVIAPLDDSPAARAGILAGDRILKINGDPTNALSIDEAVDRIRGPKGTKVTLSVFRSGEEELREIEVERDTIVVKSVKLEMRDGIAIFRLARFGEETTKEFSALVKEAKDKQAKGIILDLRNNPGGFLSTAVDIAGYFLAGSQVAVIEENADKVRHELRTSGDGQLQALPVVILINEGSASASEILAGALKDHRPDIVLVGKTSFGKGSVQELIPVSRDTAVKITVAHWLTPQGKAINKVGISPDIEVAFERNEENPKQDTQFDRALEELQKLLP
ncbi:MAG: S41 family peptidase [Candidatus Moraniibacteriota bacterium]|nr:MAG: S41 family peptidase [Candidatus Moranbacteria bacterium]